jgi:hypothetical protein
LIGRDSVPESLEKYVQLCVRLDNELQAYHNRNFDPTRQRQRNEGGDRGRQTRNSSNPEPPANPPRPQYNTGTSSLGSDPYYGPGRMDLGTTRKLTEQERAHRKTLNLCMRCGKPGHYARDCKPGPRNSGPPRPTGPPQAPRTQPKNDQSQGPAGASH